MPATAIVGNPCTTASIALIMSEPMKQSSLPDDISNRPLVFGPP
jgi:hypothetical protein